MKNTLVLLLLSISVYAQKNINNYKYVLVPNQMEAFNESDKYQTSSLTKFLLNKNGFIAFLSEENLPAEVALNKCLALKADLEDGSGMFSTIVTLVLKDCYNNVVFKAAEGKSKLKDYKKAYHEAIRKSFNSIQRLNYSYQPLTNKNESSDLHVSIKRDQKNKIVKDKSSKIKENTNYDVFAVRTISGYELKDKENKTIYTLLSTSNPNVFIVKDLNGVLLKSEEGFWSVQYYKDGALKMEVVKVKF